MLQIKLSNSKFESRILFTILAILLFAVKCSNCRGPRLDDIKLSKSADYGSFNPINEGDFCTKECLNQEPHIGCACNLIFESPTQNPCLRYSFEKILKLRQIIIYELNNERNKFAQLLHTNIAGSNMEAVFAVNYDLGLEYMAECFNKDCHKYNQIKKQCLSLSKFDYLVRESGGGSPGKTNFHYEDGYDVKEGNYDEYVEDGDKSKRDVKTLLKQQIKIKRNVKRKVKTQDNDDDDDEYKDDMEEKDDDKVIDDYNGNEAEEEEEEEEQEEEEEEEEEEAERLLRWTGSHINFDEIPKKAIQFWAKMERNTKFSTNSKIYNKNTLYWRSLTEIGCSFRYVNTDYYETYYELSVICAFGSRIINAMEGDVCEVCGSSVCNPIFKNLCGVINPIPINSNRSVRMVQPNPNVIYLLLFYYTWTDIICMGQ